MQQRTLKQRFSSERNAEVEVFIREKCFFMDMVYEVHYMSCRQLLRSCNMQIDVPKCMGFAG